MSQAKNEFSKSERDKIMKRIDKLDSTIMSIEVASSGDKSGNIWVGMSNGNILILSPKGTVTANIPAQNKAVISMLYFNDSIYSISSDKILKVFSTKVNFLNKNNNNNNNNNE